MPFALILVGALLVTAGVRDKTSELFSLVQSDFQSSGGVASFAYWMIAIAIIGMIGYIPRMEKLSRAFMALVIVVLFIKSGGVISQLNQQLFGSASATTSGTTENVLG